MVIVRHFNHLSEDGTPTAGCRSGDNDRNQHARAIAITVETLAQFYPDGTALGNRAFSFLERTGKRARTADVVVEFAAPHPEFGTGIVVEIQDSHRDKDVLATTRAYLSAGYSVCWMSVDAFGEYSLRYNKPAFEALLRNESPDGERVFDAALNPKGTIPRTNYYPLVAATRPRPRAASPTAHPPGPR